MTVLLPVYARVPGDQFAGAIDSLRGQTLPADEILVVADGPLTPELELVLEARRGSDLRVVRLAENRGLAHAMQCGLDEARFRWIARQDSDDISLPKRFETMWPVVSTGRFANVGAAMFEFEGEPSNIVAVRRMPTTPTAVRRYVRFNTPVNHPTAILDRDAVAAVGGMKHVPFMEDFDLCARLLAAGYEITNVEEPLVLFRADPEMFSRRAGRRLIAAEWVMQRNLRSYGLINGPRMLWNFVWRTSVRLAPPQLFRLLYGVAFRSRAVSVSGN